MESFFHIASLSAIIGAAYVDIRKREVPDLVSYGTIFLALAARAIFSLNDSDWMILLEGLLGGIVGFLIGALFYYTGQWGGGDTKLLAGLGAMIGVPLALEAGFFAVFAVNIFVGGAAYSIIWSVVLAIRNRKRFSEEFISVSANLQRIKIASTFILIIAGVSLFYIDDRYLRLMIFLLASALVLLIYLYSFVKAVERSVMLKEYPVGKLTEGDWIAKDVRVNGKLIVGPKDLGITKEKMELLKKHKIKNVLVKEGIPFVPSFLIAFILTYYLGNWMSLLI